MSSRWSIGLKMAQYACLGLGLSFIASVQAAAPETTSTTVTTKHGAVSKTVTTTTSTKSEAPAAAAKAQGQTKNQAPAPAQRQATKTSQATTASAVPQAAKLFKKAQANESQAKAKASASIAQDKTAAVTASRVDGQYANLPLSVYLNAMSERLEYDEAFNYVKRGKIANLSTGSNAYRIPRHMVDKVVVYKSHYLMELLKDGQVVRKYWIALSDRPQGDKQFEGDRRTPEGTYTLDYIKERSYFYRAFHISYPNPQDIAEARSLGRRPGGMIMVHGQPPSNSEYEESVQRSNWTNGCIAILNHEIDEFIELVDPGTPIEIRP